jgi:hypothetical protein
MAPDEPDPFTLDDGAPIHEPRGGRPLPDEGPKPGTTRRARAERPKSRKKAVIVFLLANLIPAACLVFWFSLPQERRDEVLEKIPPGVGGRAAIAGICFVALVVLARVVLPAAHVAGGGLVSTLAWFRTRTGGRRIALYPVEFLVYLAWVLVQVVFALDAVAIVATGLAFLAYVARIVQPDLFPWLPPT